MVGDRKCSQYLYAEASLKQVGARAVLVSPVFEAQISSGCLRLAVHMFGADVGSLLITQFPESDLTTVAVLEKYSGSLSNDWTLRQGKIF